MTKPDAVRNVTCTDPDHHGCPDCTERRAPYVTRRQNKQPASHPWMVAGERVKRERMSRIAKAIAALRARP